MFAIDLQYWIKGMHLNSFIWCSGVELNIELEVSLASTNAEYGSLNDAQ